MVWIVESFARVILSLVNGLMLFFLKFYDTFRLDIGYKKGNAQGMFDTVLPEAAKFAPAFIGLAFAILFCYGAFKILQSMTTTETKDTPISVCGRIMIGGIAIFGSYDIVFFVEKQINKIYIKFRAYMLNSLGENSSLMTDHGKTGLDVEESGAIGTNSIPSLFDTSLFENSFKDEFIVVFILTFCGVALIINMFKFTLEMVERYAMLGLLIYTAPLAFSTVASKDSGILKSWSQMVISQMILLISNLFFMTVFATGLTKTIIKPDSNTAMVDFVVRVFLLLAWLIIGQKFDEHLRSLGLGIAQSGSKLGAELIGAATTAKNIGRLGKSVANKGADKIKDAFGKKSSDMSATKPALNMNTATSEGLRNAFNSTNQQFNENAARNAAAQVMPKNKMDGATSYNLQNGKVSATNADGLTHEVGKAGMYQAENPDEALRPIHQEGIGDMVTPATSDIVQSDAQHLANQLNDQEQKDKSIPKEDKLSWEAQEDGTVLGFKDIQGENGETQRTLMGQAAPSYLAKGTTDIPDQYSNMNVKNNEVGSSFTAGVQRFSEPQATNGYIGDVKEAASSGMLQESDFSKFRTDSTVSESYFTGDTMNGGFGNAEDISSSDSFASTEFSDNSFSSNFTTDGGLSSEELSTIQNDYYDTGMYAGNNNKVGEFSTDNYNSFGYGDSMSNDLPTLEKTENAPYGEVVSGDLGNTESQSNSFSTISNNSSTNGFTTISNSSPVNGNNFTAVNNNESSMNNFHNSGSNFGNNTSSISNNVDFHKSTSTPRVERPSQNLSREMKRPSGPKPKKI